MQNIKYNASLSTPPASPSGCITSMRKRSMNDLYDVSYRRQESPKEEKNYKGRKNKEGGFVMKLTKKDKEILLSGGVSEEDFPQIEAASTGRNTIYELDGQRISRKKAIVLLKRRSFLFGLTRSAFHWSACQVTPDGQEIIFDSGTFFRT